MRVLTEENDGLRKKYECLEANKENEIQSIRAMAEAKSKEDVEALSKRNKEELLADVREKMSASKSKDMTKLRTN